MIPPQEGEGRGALLKKCEGILEDLANATTLFVKDAEGGQRNETISKVKLLLIVLSEYLYHQW